MQCDLNRNGADATAFCKMEDFTLYWTENDVVENDWVVQIYASETATSWPYPDNIFLSQEPDESVDGLDFTLPTSSSSSPSSCPPPSSPFRSSPSSSLPFLFISLCS